MDDFFDGGDGNDRANFIGEYDEYAILEFKDNNIHMKGYGPNIPTKTFSRDVKFI